MLFSCECQSYYLLLILGNRSVCLIFQSLFTYLMPVSRLPLQRVYAGSTSLFEYPIGPFLLFRAQRFLVADFSLLYEYLCLLKSVLITSDCHAPIKVFPSSAYFSLQLLFPLCTSSRLAVLCKLCIPALPHRIPGTSSTEYFFTALSSADYSLSMWSALWCTCDLLRLRNHFYDTRYFDVLCVALSYVDI